MKKSLACLAFFLISLCSVHAADIAISFSGSTTVTEGQQLQINANLIRNGETDTDAVVLSYNTEFAISEQTAATPNADYQNATGSLSWLARESGTKSFVIEIYDDLQKENIEVFDIVLSTTSNNVSIDSFNSSARYTISIQDNDVVNDSARKAGTPEQSIAQSFNVFCDKLENADVPADTNEDKLLDICGEFEIASVEETALALREISPEEVSSMSRIGQQMLSQQLGNIGNRVKSLRQGLKGGAFSQFNLKANGKSIPSWALANFGEGVLGVDKDSIGSLIRKPLEWFISGNYAFGSYGKTANESGFRPHQYGISTGVDYRYKPNMIGGIAVGLSGSNADMDDGNGNIKSKGYDLIAFATYFYQQAYYFDAVLSTGKYAFDSTRQINFILAGQQTQKTAQGSTNSQQLGLNLGAGFNKAYANGLTISSNMHLSYARNNIDNFQEQGADELNLAIDKQKTSSAQTQVGVTASKAFSHRLGVFLPQAGGRWIHEFSDDTKTISGRFISTTDSTTFSFKSDAPDRNYFLLDAGLSWVMRGAKSVFVNYQTLLGRENYRNYQFSLGLRIENVL